MRDFTWGYTVERWKRDASLSSEYVEVTRIHVQPRRFAVSFVVQGSTIPHTPLAEWRALADELASEHNVVIISDVQNVASVPVRERPPDSGYFDTDYVSPTHLRLVGMFWAIQEGEPLPPDETPRETPGETIGEAKP